MLTDMFPVQSCIGFIPYQDTRSKRTGAIQRRPGALILALLALCGSISPVNHAAARTPQRGPHLDISNQILKSGNWRLIITTHSFSGVRECHLRHANHSEMYVSGALGFDFGRKTEVMNAWIKINEQTPVRWHDYFPKLISMQVPMDGASLESPTDGVIWIPAIDLDDTSRITIQTSANRRPATYGLQGFEKLREAARTMGCLSDRQFVR